MNKPAKFVLLGVVVVLAVAGLSACKVFDMPREDGTYYYDGH